MIEDRIYKLDGLRGVLSIMVALYHYPEEMLPSLLRDWFVIREANNFVDVFFVLSGFVISYTYADFPSLGTVSSFLKRRLTRIYPLLFYTVSLTLLLSVVFYVVHRTIFIKEDGLILSEVLAQYLDSIFMLNSTPLLGSTLGLNFPSWSISAEVFSYLLFCVVLFLFTRRAPLYYILVLIVCFIFLFDLNHYYVSGDFGFVRGILNFITGYLAFKMTRIKSRLSFNLEYLGVFVFLLALYYLNGLNALEKNRIALFFVPFSSGLLVYTLVKSNGWFSRVLSSKIMVFLGNISYSVYLNHIFVSGTIVKLFVIFMGDVQSDFTKYLVCLCVLVGLILYSYLTYRWVEKVGGKLMKNLIGD